MKTIRIALAAILATILVLANIDVAFAESSKAETDKRTLEVIEKKRSEDANNLIKTLEDYKQSIDSYNLDNKSTERRVAEKTNSIHNKITGIVNLLQGNVTHVEVDTESTLKVLKIHKIGKGAPHGDNAARVIYKITSGHQSMKSFTVSIDSQEDQFRKTFKPLYPQKSTTHTVFMKVGELDSVNVSLEKK